MRKFYHLSRQENPCLSIKSVLHRIAKLVAFDDEVGKVSVAIGEPNRSHKDFIESRTSTENGTYHYSFVVLGEISKICGG